MFRFRLGRIPIEVQPSHFLYSALIGYLWVIQGQRYTADDPWPYRMLADSTGNALPGMLVLLAFWGVIAFVSTLVHELGHAVVAAGFGRAPAIQLRGFGGVTHYRSTEHDAPVWWKVVLITLAGPGFGLSLGFASALLSHLPSVGDAGRRMFHLAATANFLWSGFNLIPLPPMDGGNVSVAIFQRVFPKRGVAVAHALGLLIAALMVLIGSRVQNFFVAGFGLLFGFQAFNAMRAAWSQGSAPPPPWLVEAAKAYEAQDYPRARTFVEASLGGEELRPDILGKAQHLLGWIALKQGEGRRALDHFSQVNGRRVEPYALAAAFSLVGDDVRALPLFELGYREAPNPTLLHEWAGTLIRLGRRQDAERLPGMDALSAMTCAERVYFLRGQFREAGRAGKLAFEMAPSASRAYDVACAYARAADASDALRWLDEASARGFTDVAFAETDEDLANIQSLPQFAAWRERVRAVKAQAGSDPTEKS